MRISLFYSRPDDRVWKPPQKSRSPTPRTYEAYENKKISSGYYPYFGKYESTNLRHQESQLTAIKLIELLTTANDILSTKNTSVNCMPMGFCSCIYGTVEDHFDRFGWINPYDAKCLVTFLKLF